MFSDIIPTRIGTGDGRQVEALDIFGNVLRRADNSRALGRYLCRELARLTGAGHGLLLLAPRSGGGDPDIRILDEWTEQAVPLADRPGVMDLAENVLALQEPTLVRPRRMGSQIERMVQKIGAGQMMILPLGTRENMSGLLFLSGVPEDPLLEAVLEGIKLPCTLIGLVLNNALLFENQQNALARRTEELTATENLYEALANLSPMGVFRCSLDGAVTRMNQKCREMGDFSQDSCSREEWESRIHPEDREAVERAWRRASEELEPVSMEKRLVSRTGSTIWISAHVAPEMGADGRVAGLIGMIMDITDRRRAQVELERSERNYRSIFDTAANLITSFDATGKIIDVNGQSLQILGYEPEELIGENVAKIIHPDYMRKARRSLREIVRDGFAYDREYRMVRKDGRVIDVMINSSALREENERFLRVICIIDDITERRRTEEALRESESKFRAITENTSDITMILDAGGRYRYISPSLNRFIDGELHEMLGTMPGKFLHPVDVPVVREYIDLAARTPGKTLQISDIRIMHKDGRWHHLGVSLTGMLDVPGVNGIVVGCRDVTDRKIAEEELRKFKTITDRASYGAVINDLEGRLLYVNRAFAQMHGYTVQELLGRNASVLHAREDLERVYELRQRVQREGSVSAEDLDHRRKDGTRFPTLHNATLIRDDLGKPLFISASYVDATEVKRAEQALKESERRLSTLMGNLPGMAYRCLNDRHWTMEFVSQGCEKLTGYKPEHLIGNKGISYNHVIHPEDRKMVWEEVQAGIEAGETFRLEYRIITADREEKWAFEQGRGVPGPDGGIEAIEGFITDITERVRAEQQRRVSEKRYRTLFSMMMDGFAVHELIRDQNGKPCDYEFIEVNPSFEAITGIRARDALDRRASEILPKQNDRWCELYAQVVDTGEPIRFEQYSEDVGRHFEVFAYRVQGNQFATVFRDISERVRAEAEARKLNEELEARVAERTAELWEANTALQETNTALHESQDQIRETQAELIESKKMAALGGLVAGVAHEINTPVGIGVTAASHLAEKTTGFAEKYRAGTLKRSDFEGYLDVCNEAVRMIQANLNRAAELIQSFKQVAVDRSSQQRRRFSMKPFLEEVLLSLRPELKKTSHVVEIECPDDLEIDGFPGALSQIVTNFVMNSLMHGFEKEKEEEGRIRFVVSREGGDVRMAYSDNGCGMKPSIREKIFEPFFTTKRGRGGSGLGLHVVYNLVTRTLGGRLHCSSEPGKGTTFEVVFPANEDTEHADD